MSISIALCTYNGAVYLKELLQSIIQQSVLPDEMVISDDASSDGTIEILQKFSEGQSFLIKLLTSETTRGVNQNYEVALKHCTGDMIFIADQDDVWNANKIELLSQTLIATASDAIFTNADIIDDEGISGESKIWDYFKFNDSGNFNQTELLQRNMLSNVVTGSTMVLRREVLSQVLPFPAHDDSIYDEWLATIILASPDLVLTPFSQSVMNYRVHEGQFTAKYRDTVERELPFNWLVNYQFIRRRQRLFAALDDHPSIKKLRHKELQSAKRLWNVRLSNYEAFSIKIKAALIAKFLKGQYHSLVRWPYKSLLKDIIVMPRKHEQHDAH